MSPVRWSRSRNARSESALTTKGKKAKEFTDCGAVHSHVAPVDPVKAQSEMSLFL